MGVNKKKKKIPHIFNFGTHFDIRLYKRRSRVAVESLVD